MFAYSLATQKITNVATTKRKN